MEGAAAGASVLADLGHEVFELSSVEDTVLVDIGSLEGCSKLSHSLGLGLLDAPGGALGLEGTLLLVVEGLHPGESHISNGVKVLHRVLVRRFF